MAKKYAVLLSEDQIRLINRVFKFFKFFPFNLYNTFSKSEIEEIETLRDLADVDLLVEYAENLPRSQRIVNDWVECYLDNIEG